MKGVYKISTTIDNRVYIGSSINIDKRWNEHKNHLKKGKHINTHLQNFVNKYGLDTLQFSMLEECDNTLEREQYFIEQHPIRFNIAINATAPMQGKKHTKEAKEKISKAFSGKLNPMYGIKRPAYIGEKVREISTGRIKTQEEIILRKINLKNRKEIIINRNGISYICFSIAHAAKIIGVSQQSVSKALQKSYLCKGCQIEINENVFYEKDFIIKHLDLFDADCHPQPELITMLKSLK